MGTDFYGTLTWAAGYIRGEKGRKGVIVFSDGRQSNRGGSGSTLKQALERVRQVNVPFYFVGYDTTATTEGEMKQLADASGGRAFFPREPEELVGVYEQIARDLGRAYTISYVSPKSPDGRFRKIQVRTIDVRLRVAQSRDGYYAR
jgi:VWFA-related protein